MYIYDNQNPTKPVQIASYSHVLSCDPVVTDGDYAYDATMAGVVGFTRCAALRYAREGIRINAICPGVIDTPMTQAVPDEYLEPLVKATPLRRQGTASDIANTALFLACDEGSFLTGQALSPNGGLVID